MYFFCCVMLMPGACGVVAVPCLLCGFPLRHGNIDCLWCCNCSLSAVMPGACGVAAVPCCVYFFCVMLMRVPVVLQLFRHGDRSAVKSFPGDLHAESAWPQGYGQLSQVSEQHRSHRSHRSGLSVGAGHTHSKPHVIH